MLPHFLKIIRGFDFFLYSIGISEETENLSEHIQSNVKILVVVNKLGPLHFS
jgi:hypothetical protein